MSKHDLGYKHENHSFSFPDEETSLPFHPPSVILSVFFCPASILFSLYGRVSVPGPCGGRSLDPFFMIFFLICFISISICMAEDEMAAVSFDRYHRLILPSFVWFLYFHSKHISPSIFLFFLNVIVKCSSEMTLNMCTLTEGIHLVIYFLIPVLRGLFAALPPGVLWTYTRYLPYNHHFP